MLYEGNLFERVIKSNSAKKAKILRIISGYATPEMLQYHIAAFPKLKIFVYLGMTSKDGIQLLYHKKFLDLVRNNKNIKCFYNTQSPHIHSKIYLWETAEDSPLYAVVGSANYTTNGLVGNQEEVLCECPASDAQNYINRIIKNSKFIDCESPDAEQYITTEKYCPPRKSRSRKNVSIKEDLVIADLPYVDLSLLTSKGEEYAAGGGINWGQRDGRNPNQSYIAIPAPIQRQKFFPPKGKVFTVLANKNQFIKMVVAQGDHGKALHSHEDNSELGVFLRQRLSLDSGCFVHKKDLRSKTTVRFYKVDDENFYMEF